MEQLGKRLKSSLNRLSPTLYENPILQTQMPHNQEGSTTTPGARKPLTKPP